MKGTGPLIGENYVSAPIALIIIGVAVFLLAFLGCCGASQESYCMLTMVSSSEGAIEFSILERAPGNTNETKVTE